MKNIICILLFASIAWTSEFEFSKDTMFAEDLLAGEIDTIKVRNLSNDTLVFDSIYTDTVFGIPDKARADGSYYQMLSWASFRYDIYPENRNLYSIGYGFGFGRYHFDWVQIRIKPTDSISLTNLRGHMILPLGKRTERTGILATIVVKQVYVSGLCRKNLYVKMEYIFSFIVSTLPQQKALLSKGIVTVQQGQVNLLGRNTGGIKQASAPGIYFDGKDKRVRFNTRNFGESR
jgi:hypothetical protein